MSVNKFVSRGVEQVRTKLIFPTIFPLKSGMCIISECILYSNLYSSRSRHGRVAIMSSQSRRQPSSSCTWCTAVSGPAAVIADSLCDRRKVRFTGN